MLRGTWETIAQWFIERVGPSRLCLPCTHVVSKGSVVVGTVGAGRVVGVVGAGGVGVGAGIGVRVGNVIKPFI